MKFCDIKLSSDGIKEAKAWEWIVRFVFGGLVSLGAGLIGEQWGPVVGGLFLAFPSILPASLTFVKQHKGRAQAAEEAWGACLGSFGLIAFAAVIWAAAESAEHPAAVLVAAVVAWLVVSGLMWRVCGDRV